jgi:peptidoglycan/LPS O-acetylase OafA/YrhL
VVFWLVKACNVLPPPHSRINSKYSVNHNIAFLSNGVFDFLWKRTLRIFPALMVVLLLSVFVLGPICTSLSVNQYLLSSETYQYFKLIKLYPFVQNELLGVFKNNPETAVNGSLWTLPYEVTMYLFLVFLQMINLFQNRKILLLLSLIILPFIIYVYFNFSPITLIPILHLQLLHILEFGIFFMFGSIMFLFKDKIPFKFVYFILMVFLWFGLGMMHVTSSVMIKIISFFALPYIVLYLAHLKGRINNFSKLGDFSYGIYIYAYPVQQMLINFYGVNLGVTKLFIFSSLIVFPLSALSWFFVEERALKLKSIKFG